MRRPPILPLILGLSLCGCSDAVDPPADGILAVSTSTSGDDPDPDGFQLTIDGSDSLALLPSGTAGVAVSAGRHTLSLLDVASHCSVTPAATLEVEVSPGSTTPVAFEVTCPLTGVRVAVTTTGLDLDPDGYRVVLDESDQGGISPNNIVTLRRLEAGSRTIALTGLAPNCAVDGPTSRTVTVVTAQVATVEFAVVCTASNGVIGVIVEASGTDVEGRYEAMVDGARYFFDGPGGPDYLTAVPTGDHVVSLVPPANCSVETEPRPVTLIGGALIRDTVTVTFSVTCTRAFGTLLVTAPTTGTIPQDNYSLWLCYDSYSCNYHFPGRSLGTLAPNGTLIAEVDPGTYWLHLEDLFDCQVVEGNASHGFNPKRNIVVRANELTSVSFVVVCP